MVINKKATRAETKEHNRRFILKTIYQNETISRAEVARRTGLTRTTISAVVSELLEEELVEEVGIGARVIGKPPTLLSMVKHKRLVLTVDLAEDRFRGCLLDLRGHIKHEIRQSLQGRKGDEALQVLHSIITTLTEASEAEILGIGIGSPGVVDSDAGVIRSAINLDWHDLALAQMVYSWTGLEVQLRNDSQVAALGQHLFGEEGKGSNNLILLKVGRGVSAGIVLAGELLRGDGFGTGEIGHLVVDPEGGMCSCGNHGCLEAVAGREALLARVAISAKNQSSSLLYEDLQLGRPLSIYAVADAVRHGDTTPLPALEVSARHIGAAIANLVGTLHIRTIILSGGFCQFGESLLEPIRAEVARRMMPSLYEELTITETDLQSNGVILGAAALVMRHALGVL